MNKIKGFISENRYALMAAATPVMMGLCSAGAVDDASSFDLATTMTTSVTTIVNNLLAMITKVVPVSVTLLAAAIGINYGIRFIKKIIGKAG